MVDGGIDPRGLQWVVKKPKGFVKRPISAKKPWPVHRGVFVVRSLIGALSLSFCISCVCRASNCVDLTRQLSEMQKAQTILLESMVHKNDSLANVLDRYAGDFEASELRLAKTDIESMQKSANAFRQHKQREQTLIQKFNRQSQLLITKANDCLMASQRLGGISTP